jgi:glycosidase
MPKQVVLTRRGIRGAVVRPSRWRVRPRCLALEARETPDVSAPAILQFFESTHTNMERRMPDVFRAGYGSIWAPPPGQADIGDFSVGYDVYERFDLGSPANPTLYGTETGLKTAIRELNRAGGLYYSDYIINHNGFSDWSTPGFLNAGGYPGFFMSTGGGSWGDFHDPNATGDLNYRLSGLIDIAQESNNQYVRSPVPGFANNLPAGTTPAFGRIANVPAESNRRFYPDQGLAPIVVNDPATGASNVVIYPFNTANPTAGDPVAENALGYLMRYAQWMVQEIGVDGFRLDAVKHAPTWAFNFFDRAVFRASPKTLLDGSQPRVFSFGEAFDGNKPFVQTYIRKDAYNPGVVGGNRDALDFPLFFAIQSNFTSNGLQNSFFNVVNASQDSQDDGLANNGSQGVAFVQSHDSDGPYLSNVAYAYTLMRPGNAIVYFNAEQFGTGRDFPKDGRGDALGGLYGDAITKLVQIRNGYGRGNYQQRWLDKETLIYERQNSALVLLNNRTDSGYDTRTVQTSFAPGTVLVELTGNATNSTIDPVNEIFDSVTVNGSGQVTVRIPRNKTGTVAHNNGYLIYAPAAPNGTLTIVGATGSIAAEAPTAGTNGTALLSALPVVTGDSFQVRLDTTAFVLPGGGRDFDADGDNAIIRINGGLDLNGNGVVDHVVPGSDSYGFEQFVTTKSPGFGSPDGNGLYVQTIDATQLPEGVNYITVRAFRRRAGGPAIYRDYKVAVYVDRLAPAVTIDSFNPAVAGVNQNRVVRVRSADLTANNVHVFLNLPAGLSDATVIGLVGGGSQASGIDRDLWSRQFNNLLSGNHVITTVTFERSGRVDVERFVNYSVTGGVGAGLGDLNGDGLYTAGDVSAFAAILNSNNTQFNPAADFNGDGLVNNTDLLLLGQKLTQVGATSALSFYRSILGPPAAFTIIEGGTLNLAVNQPAGTIAPALTFSWDLNNDGTFGDATGSPTPVPWSQLVSLGVNVAGSYTVAVRSTEGTTTFTQTATLTVNAAPPAATLGNSGPVGQFATNAVVSFTNVSHPSPPVQSAGFTYSYDFDNDGTFEITDSASSSVAVPAGFLVAPQRVVRGRVRATGNGLFSDFTTAVAVVAPPRVAAFQVNDGSPQRSRVTGVTVSFDSVVTLPVPPESAFTLTGPGGVVVTLTADLSGSTATQTIVRLTFSGAGTFGGSLVDGRFTLAVNSAVITDGFGQALDGDGDGLAGGAYAAEFHRLFGDIDGDADVDAADFAAFRGAFGGVTNLAFDFDGDGDVDAADFAAFRQRFGSSV